MGEYIILQTIRDRQRLYSWMSPMELATLSSQMMLLSSSPLRMATLSVNHGTV